MKILVDKLPQTTDDCLFCLKGDDGYHRCLFNLDAYDFSHLSTTYRDCYLTTGRECPFLKEINNDEF